MEATRSLHLEVMNQRIECMRAINHVVCSPVQYNAHNPYCIHSREFTGGATTGGHLQFNTVLLYCHKRQFNSCKQHP